jgi:hypothetical protein
MAGTRRADKSRLRAARGFVVAAVLCALAAVAPTALASSPARGEYQLQLPSAGPGGGTGGGGGARPSDPGQVGSSQSDSALPALVLGFAAIGAGGLAFAYIRRRRSGQVS